MKLKLRGEKSIEVKASRWPWQTQDAHWSNKAGKKYGWRAKDCLMGRFGGGWNYCLGVRASSGKYSTSVNFELLFGMVHFTYIRKIYVRPEPAVTPDSVNEFTI